MLFLGASPAQLFLICTQLPYRLLVAPERGWGRGEGRLVQQNQPKPANAYQALSHVPSVSPSPSRVSTH